MVSMQKIITVFQRNDETDRLVRDEVVPGAEWVLAGEGITNPDKWDGACCLVRQGKSFKRYELKRGKTHRLISAPSRMGMPLRARALAGFLLATGRKTSGSGPRGRMPQATSPK